MKIRFGFKNYLFVLACINVFKLSNRSLILFLSFNPTFTLLVFLKNKILHTFPSLTNHYYGRFEKAELDITTGGKTLNKPSWINDEEETR